MKKKYPSSRSSLFLIELILSVLILALCTTVCIRIFAASWQDRRQAREWNHIQELLTNTAEIFEATDGSAEALLQYLPSGSIDNGEVLYYYTSVWDSADAENAVYKLSLYPQTFDDWKSLQISFFHLDKNEATLLYETELHVPVFSISKEGGI